MEDLSQIIAAAASKYFTLTRLAEMLNLHYSVVDVYVLELVDVRRGAKS